MRLHHLLWLVAGLAVAACAGRTQLESDLGIKGAPDWVNKGTAYVKDRDGRLFHGVGSAAPMGDTALQRSTADDRARAEVARIFSSYVDMVSHDYQAASRSGGTGANEEAVSRQIKNLTQVNLAGAKIVAHWIDKRTNTLYAIAELDSKHVKETITAAQDMNADVRRYVDANADNVFDRAAKEKP
ncbi:MAG: LPP20 family lipoprotein [Sulfurifustaceae bacterium]